MSKTISEVKEWFSNLEVSAEIKFNGKTLSINGTNFRIPKTENLDTRMKFDAKVDSYVRSLFPENMEIKLTEKYTNLSNELKLQQISIDFSRINYSAYCSKDIKRSIEDAKKLLEFVSTYPEFYSIIEKYSAYRNLIDRGWMILLSRLSRLVIKSLNKIKWR